MKMLNTTFKKLDGIFIRYAFYAIDFCSTFWQALIFKLNNMLATNFITILIMSLDTIPWVYNIFKLGIFLKYE